MPHENSYVMVAEFGSTFLRGRGGGLNWMKSMESTKTKQGIAMHSACARSLNFVKQVIQVSVMTKRVAILENRLHILHLLCSWPYWLALSLIERTQKSALEIHKSLCHSKELNLLSQKFIFAPARMYRSENIANPPSYNSKKPLNEWGIKYVALGCYVTNRNLEGQCDSR